jgi:hypothetical protein
MLPPTVSKASYKERVPSISRAAASIKRTFSERKTSTPPVSPEKKKKKVSAIRTALERSPKGLMRFLKKCTPAEHDQEIQRTAEEENERYLEREERLLEHKAHRTVELRDGARIRQKKHRQRTYNKEIALGERTPGGTKQIQKVSENICEFSSHRTDLTTTATNC